MTDFHYLIRDSYIYHVMYMLMEKNKKMLLLEVASHMSRVCQIREENKNSAIIKFNWDILSKKKKKIQLGHKDTYSSYPLKFHRHLCIAFCLGV